MQNNNGKKTKYMWFYMLLTVFLVISCKEQTKVEIQIEALTDQIKATPNNSDLHTELARIKINIKDSTSIKDIQNALAIDSTNGSALFQKGRYYSIILMDNKKAVGMYTLAIEHVNTDSLRAKIYSALGNRFRALDNKPKAIKSYQKAVKYDSLNASTYYQLSIVHGQLKEYKVALAYINKAIATEVNADYYSWRGNLNFDSKHYKEARSDYNKAFGLDSLNKDALKWMLIASEKYNSMPDKWYNYKLKNYVIPLTKPYNDAEVTMGLSFKYSYKKDAVLLQLTNGYQSFSFSCNQQCIKDMSRSIQKYYVWKKQAKTSKMKINKVITNTMVTDGKWKHPFSTQWINSNDFNMYFHITTNRIGQYFYTIKFDMMRNKSKKFELIPLYFTNKNVKRLSEYFNQKNIDIQKEKIIKRTFVEDSFT